MLMNRVQAVDDFVPVIDMSARDSARERAAVAEAIGTACAGSGFFIMAGHGVPQKLVDRMFTVTDAFFRMPAPDKQLVANRPGVSGFRRTGGTTALTLGRRTPPDLCEAFSAHVTGDLPAVQRAKLGDEFATWTLANIWPQAPVGLRQVWYDYMEALTELSADLLRLCALALGLDERFFDDKFDHHVSSVTANYYYPQVQAPLPGQLRRGPHTDFGALTVLHQQDDRGGLQVLQDRCQWRDVPAVPGSYVVNIGDLMALWTGGRWVSTMHRVVNPAGGDTSSRLTIPFFYLPNHDASIEPMRPFTGAAAASMNGYLPGGGTTAGQWMSRKLKEMFTPVS
jgi:isopenicillin N synthase-like dioxygenase